jgi:hypothetical protein
MTAKKMADIFFGKFSELVSKEQDVKKINEEQSIENKVPHEKKSQNKILIYSSIAILLAMAIYLIS